MKIRSLLLPLIIAMSLIGCDKTNNQANKTSTASSVSSSNTTTTSTNQDHLQRYTAFSDMTYPPFEEKDNNGKATGMEIEIFNAIAKDQGFQVDYLPHAWEGSFEALNKDKDAVFLISAVTKTDEAKANALLSDAYYISPYRVASLDQTKMTNWQQQPKIGISDSEDSSEDLPTKYNVKPEQLVHFKTVFLALGALLRGEVDTVVADSTVMQYYMGTATFKNSGKKFYQEDFGDANSDSSKLVFAVKKGHEDLLGKINTGLANIKKSGELNKILEKYGQNPAEVEKKLSNIAQPTTASTAHP